jgi:hypothetical protein
MLFLLVVEGLILLIKHKHDAWVLKGIVIDLGAIITHLMFVDDLVLFSNGAVAEVRLLGGLLSLFCEAT